MHLGENIYRLRTQKNMSQGDLADALEVSRQSVSKWENDSAVPELEKLMKMAQIFDITLDELVSGEAKTAATPPPVATAAHRERQLTTGQIIGIVLLVFGGLCFIVFTVVGIFTGGTLLGLVIALPFLLCGLVCLLCKKNVGLLCAWGVYVPLWFVCAVLLVASVTMLFPVVIIGIVLTAVTMVRMCSGQIALPRWAKTLLSIAMILGIVIPLIALLPPPVAQVPITNETHIVTPVDPSAGDKLPQ